MQQTSTLLSPEKIKFLRKDNGWSQELLAKAAGVSLRTIQRAEKDGNSSTETQLALAAAFDIFPNELAQEQSTPEVNWKRKSIMQSSLALAVVLGAVYMLVVLAGNLSMFIDTWSILFLLLFMYSGTVIAFGGHGLIKSVVGLKYLFATDINSTPASSHLARILKKQIHFIYGGAAVGFLIGSIAIHSHIGKGDPIAQGIHPAYAVCLLVVLYAAIISEGILRPLASKLEAPE